jgi:hypothetical protein
MPRLVLLACLAMLPQFAVAHGGNERLGTAGAAGAQMCAALQADDARVGERVLVVDPNPPQRVRWATLELDATGTCAKWQAGADVPGRVFALRSAAVTDDTGFIGIVVRGATRVSLQHAKAVVQIAGKPALRFRSCTSSEGLHLSAWPSAEPAGRPYWHAYAYLGYDVEPTCTDAEMRDAR